MCANITDFFAGLRIAAKFASLDICCNFVPVNLIKNDLIYEIKILQFNHIHCYLYISLF
jgi:hypothetical protein